MSKNKVLSPMGDDWADLRQTLLNPQERAATDVKIALLDEIIKSRQDKGLSQKKLEEISGVKQPVIARLEHGTTDPQLSTIIKVLISMGKTLAVVPLEQAQ
ncbi:MAG: helix-turn-helix domain-containing protein [Clostridiales Family XIII bacterium]|jgi:ribosome-binding protein aMBF1 (putative translation factor)|nr:helix-turn-helix domain-containing protein [Clostridiales Family XIII bacterium]